MANEGGVLNGSSKQIGGRGGSGGVWTLVFGLGLHHATSRHVTDAAGGLIIAANRGSVGGLVFGIIL